jgi:hypothetical protein
LESIWSPNGQIYGNELVEKVAWYADNDGVRTGGSQTGSTSTGIFQGAIQWFEDVGLNDFYTIIDYDVRDENAFEEIVYLITNDGCVVLNLGFYSNSGMKYGNHWVTVAGVDLSSSLIALSDPYYDVASPTNNPELHNDASIVSHDIFIVNTNSPLSQYSSFWLEDYKPDFAPNTNALIIDALIIINNVKPNKPNINGPNSGSVEEEYTYITSTIDTDGNQIYYLFDWGDGNNSEWIGHFESGEECSESHVWTEEGTFEIKVKSKDIYDVESDWSDSLVLTMPKSNNLLDLFLQFLENHPIIYRILQLIN